MGLGAVVGRLVPAVMQPRVLGVPVVPALAVGLAVARVLDTPSRRYNRERNTVAKEYDAWTQDGVLEHYWGEHIHLGWCVWWPFELLSAERCLCGIVLPRD